VEERPLNKFGSNVCTNGWQNQAKWFANHDQTTIGHLFYTAYICTIVPVHHNIEQVNIVHT
jgi:hypothetical protein